MELPATAPVVGAAPSAYWLAREFGRLSWVHATRLSPLTSTDHDRLPDTIAQIVTPPNLVGGEWVEQDHEFKRYDIVGIDIRLRQTIFSLHRILSFSDNGRRMNHHAYYVGRTAALF